MSILKTKKSSKSVNSYKITYREYYSSSYFANCFKKNKKRFSMSFTITSWFGQTNNTRKKGSDDDNIICNW